MIPKIIHYCWFGRGEMSSLQKKCIRSWRKYCPDYEIIEWNEDNFDTNFCSFCSEAYKNGKYAFVADVARMFALSKEGGIYLDTDMLLIQPISEMLLNRDFFIGMEDKKYLNAAIYGSVPDHIFTNRALLLYGNLEHSNTFQLITEILLKVFPEFIKPVDIELNINGGVIFPVRYFYPLPYKLRKFHWRRFIGRETIGVHLWEGTWKDSDWTIKERIRYYVSKYYLPESIKNSMF